MSDNLRSVYMPRESALRTPCSVLVSTVSYLTAPGQASPCPTSSVLSWSGRNMLLRLSHHTSVNIYMARPTPPIQSQLLLEAMDPKLCPDAGPEKGLVVPEALDL